MSATIECVGRLVRKPYSASCNEHRAVSAMVAISLSDTGGDNHPHDILVVAIGPALDQLARCEGGDLVRVTGSLIAHRRNLVIAAEAVVQLRQVEPVSSRRKRTV